MTKLWRAVRSTANPSRAILVTKIQAKRNGEKFQDHQISEFKLLDKVDPKVFTEPQ